MDKRTFPKAHETSNLQVGKMYSVAHVKVKIRDFDIELEVPINPKLHNDKIDFDFDDDHYHVDGRFIKDNTKLAYRYWIDNGKTNTVVLKHTPIYKVSEVFYKTKKCLRLTTGIKGDESQKVYATFVKKYTGRKCKGRKCPHWGVIMNNIDGVLVCPMHGLKGSLDTLKIIG